MSHLLVPYLICLVLYGSVRVSAVNELEGEVEVAYYAAAVILLSIVVPFCLRYDYNGNNVQLLQKDRRLLFSLFPRVDHDDDDDDRSSGVSDSSKITYSPSH